MIIANTLSPEALPGLTDGLRRLGATVRSRPLLAVHPLRDHSLLADSLSTLGPARTLALTSPRAAAIVRQVMSNRPPPPVPVWAIGPSTAGALPDRWDVRTPAEANAASLACAMLAAGIRGSVVHPCGAERREELARELEVDGVRVEPIVCYRTEVAGPESIRGALAEVDLAIIGSPRAIQRAAEVMPRSERPPLLCLGPTTARSATTAGWRVAGIASEPTVEGVLAVARTLCSVPPAADGSGDPCGHELQRPFQLERA